MCYILTLSTDSSADLTAHNDELVVFDRTLPGIAEEALLAYPHMWYIGSRDGCSCGFRHLAEQSVELGFGEPVDWYEEEAEDLEATRRLSAVIRALVGDGAKVDCIDAWNGSQRDPVLAGTVTVGLASVRDTAFRLFENHRFVFTAETTT